MTSFVDPGPERRASALRRLLVLAVPVLIVAAMGWERRWTSDDGFINLRIVAQLRAGHGPVFNTGERVEAFTSPLWVAVLWLTDLLAPARLEWIAVTLALALTITGLACAIAGSARLLAARGTRGGVFLPLGALVYAVLPPAWDFATSGLENGLGLGWLGAAWLGLASRCARAGPGPAAAAQARPDRPVWFPVLLGLGPLVRPDFALFTVCFLGLLVWQDRSRSWRTALRAVIAAALLPLLYQVFRMGYYASLVPNTALAKEAGLANWTQGAAYLTDFVATYALWLPLLVLVPAFLVAVMTENRGTRPRAEALLVGAVLATALAHGLYVTRVGGDFMHGRMLLPTLFATLLPVAVVAVRGWRWMLATGIVVWALVCALYFRVNYPNDVGPDQIADERGWYADAASREHPVLVEDYSEFEWAETGSMLRDLAAARARVLVLYPDDRPDELMPLADEISANVVVRFRTIGIRGIMAGLDVFVEDALGLAEPIAARFRLSERDRPGHEKVLGRAWTVARFARADAALPIPPEVSYFDHQDVNLARRTLACRPVRELLEAVTGALTPARFVANVIASPRLTALRIPEDPAEAKRELCGSE